MKQSFSEKLTIEIAKLLSPLLLLDTIEEIQTLLIELGYDIDLTDIPSNTDFRQPIQDIINLFDRITDLPNLSDEDRKDELIDIGKDLITLVKNVNDDIVAPLKSLITSLPNPNSLPRRLGDYLVYKYLDDHHRKIFASNHLLGIAEIEEVDDIPTNTKKEIKTIQWNRLGKLFSKPIDVFDQVYNWSAGFENSGAEDYADKFLERFEKLVVALGLAGGIYEQTTEIQTAIGTPAGNKEIRMPLYQDGVWPDDWRELDLNITQIPSDGTNGAGLYIYPYFFGGVTLNDDIGENWRFELDADTTIGSGFGLSIRPPIKLKVWADMSATTDTGTLKLDLNAIRKEQSELMYLFGNSEATHLSLASYDILAFIDKENTKREDLGIELNLHKLRFELKKGEGDGFLNKIIPDNGMEAEFDITVGYSLEKGFYFDGSGSYGINIPLHLKIGPLNLQEFVFNFKPGDEGLQLDLGTTFDLKLGPILALVENIGLTNLLKFPDSASTDFNLAELAAGFKFPNGIGLNIDTAAVKGGGYLYINKAEGRYAGVAGLNIKDKIQLSAFGLIATKFPDGTNDKYSFLIFISAEFAPIQLGFGFTLNGVGGIVGIHRTINVEKLRAGVKTGAYDRLLFPANPVEDALEIISDLRAIFPIEEGRYVFGIMGKLGWGTPTLITAEVGLILEVPNPVRFAILGVVKAVLPDEAGKILKLNVNFLGLIDFGQKRLSFDASIYDSRLLSFTLAGDMAVRLSWGNNSNFILSVGGFHPSFKTPSGLTGMKRLTLNLLGGNNPRLTLTSYFAVTSNSVQFGAKVEVYVKVSKKLTAEGYLSFDALFQFNPFYTHILAAAYMALKWKGKDKMSVTVKISLEGPTPWIVDGLAEIKILGIKFKVKVKKTWGKSQNTTLPTVTVEDKLIAALKDNRNWEAVFPPSNGQVVKLLEFSEEDKLILHPMGSLQVSQKVLPLNLDVQMFGNQEVSDGGQYSFSANINGDPGDFSARKEDFAPAHFRKMSETQKLSSPSFVKYDGGIRVTGVAGNRMSGSSLVDKIVEHELILFEASNNSLNDPPVFIPERTEVMSAMVRGGKAGQSGLSYSRKIAPLAPDEITVLEEKYGVVNISNMQLFDSDSKRSSFAEAVDRYAQIVSTDINLKNELKVVPEFEIQ